MKKIILFALCMSLAVMSAGCGSSEDAFTGESSFIEFAGNGAAEADAAPTAAEAAAGECDPVPSPSDKKSDEAEGEALPASDDIEYFDGSADAVEEEGDYKASSDEISLPDESSAGDSVTGDDEFGLLTAGRWNDNSNWGFFSNIVDNDLVVFPSFGLDPCSRVSVSVKDGSGSPAVNSKVVLYDGEGNRIWAADTDKEGRAYLFTCGRSGSMKVTAYGNDGSEQSSDISVEQTGGDQQGKTKKVASAETEIVIGSKADIHKDMQVMFIMDATGSMGDEMFFLQKDFSAIARECGTENTEYSVNFYRDHGDDYVTRCFDFSKDIKDIQNKINEQSADGGGDAPEAVAEILEETMNSSGWRDDAVKVAFLIFDAPPHSGKEDVLSEAVKTAAEKGIRLVPVVSSNADRRTELFGRAAAIMTNGEYVFLTDDSGIGGSHLEPIIGDYEVQKLYDIIINIIAEYRQQ